MEIAVASDGIDAVSTVLDCVESWCQQQWYKLGKRSPHYHAPTLSTILTNPNTISMIPNSLQPGPWTSQKIISCLLKGTPEFSRGIRWSFWINIWWSCSSSSFLSPTVTHLQLMPKWKPEKATARATIQRNDSRITSLKIMPRYKEATAKSEKGCSCYGFL